MKITRRELGSIVGAASAAAASPWARAEAQMTQGGEISRETTLALLDASGARGLFEDEEELELLRRALENHLRSRRRLQAHELPESTEPAVTFRR